VTDAADAGAAHALALHAEGVRATAEMRPADGERLLRAALRSLPRTSASLPRTSAPSAVPALRGRILLSLAHALAEQGQVGAGLRALAQAESLLPPTGRGVLYGQRALMLLRTGRDDLALPQFDAAIAALAAGFVPEPADLARALLNRAVLHLGTARVGAARADLIRCADVATRHGLATLAAKADHNLAYLDFLAGDLPRALRAYGRLSQRYAELMPTVLPVLAVDRARALLAAGLYGEADAELADAMERFERQRLSQDHAEATLARAEAALLAGEPEAAGRWARQAHRRFERRGNARWAALADLCGLRADFALARPRPGSRPAARRLAARSVAARLAARAAALSARLETLGFADDAQLAAALGVRALVRAGRPAAVGPVLRRGQRSDVRLQWWLAQAEVAAAAGRPREARRRLREGLDELARRRGRLGCLDLQTSAAVHGREVAEVGLRAALAGGRPAQVYQWSERVRAQALLTPVLPPDDPDAATLVGELRQVHFGLREAELAGRATGTLRARRAVLQRRLRELDWGAPGSTATVASATATSAASASASAGPVSVGPVSLAAVRAELGSAAMVAYLRDGAGLHAWVMAAGRTRVVGLGAVDVAERAVLRLLADLDAQAGRSMPRRLAEAVEAATARDIEAVQAAILDPLLHIVGDRELVVVPTGALATVPWGMLPSCAGRPVTVAPSATTWVASRRRAARCVPGSEPALLVAGPGTGRGEAEIRAIAALRPESTVLTGGDATPEATLRGLGSVTMAHLSAHGCHEPDNPLFSTVELAGGPLMGYDLQRLSSVPTTVVLSTCDLGLTHVRPGDETLGIATVLLSAGTSTVVASVSRVGDEVAMDVMARYHAAAVAGRSPAVALAEAGSPGQVSGFICVGAG
jgi:tetratricopeptide (TPR) repeat protein